MSRTLTGKVHTQQRTTIMWTGLTGWQRNNLKKTGMNAWRPHLEELENRLAPAVFHVNTFQDTPVANLATGQDAAGYVSLRSAMAAANANPQHDTIYLDAGIYQASGGRDHRSEQRADHRQGSRPDLLASRSYSTPIFDANGSLQIESLTLTGPVDMLFRGNVQLQNTHVTDADIIAVTDALFASRTSTPVPAVTVYNLQASLSTLQEFNLQTATTSTLVGPIGGGATSDDESAPIEDIHQTFWRLESAPALQQAPQETPDNSSQQEPATPRINPGDVSVFEDDLELWF